MPFYITFDHSRVGERHFELHENDKVPECQHNKYIIIYPLGDSPIFSYDGVFHQNNEIVVCNCSNKQFITIKVMLSDPKFSCITSISDRGNTCDASLYSHVFIIEKGSSYTFGENRIMVGQNIIKCMCAK